MNTLQREALAIKKRATRRVSRMRLERRVVRSACRELMEQRCEISLYYGEGDYGVKRAVTPGAVVKAMHACDDEWLIVWRGSVRLGTVYLVYGNDGWDVMADMHVAIDNMIPETNALIETLQG